MIKSKTIACMLIGFLLFAAQASFAAEFGPNSHNITNPYMPLKVGDWRFSRGFGPNWAHKIFHIHAVGTETVSGATIDGQVFDNVKTLKANIAITDEEGSADHEFLTFSFAQDTEGNVWVMKMHSHMNDTSGYLGGPYFQSMFMPAEPAVGLPAAIKMPEDENNYCRIVRTGIGSLTTTYGTYENCIEVNCYDEDPLDIEVEYFCPRVGIVRQTSEDSPENYMDLKEQGRALDYRAVVIPMGN
jgi:hypothetical protein